MRKFSSYGRLDRELHYYAPRTALLEKAYTQLVGDNPHKGGHYITVWAPRQTGKSSVMLQVVQKIKQGDEFDVAIITMESAKDETCAETVLRIFVRHLQAKLTTPFPEITTWNQVPELFTRTYLNKPLILILDEFDALQEAFINKFASEFRMISTDRNNEPDTPGAEKRYLLHGLALIGVRSVLGIENVSGSPFNVQRGLHIPNLTSTEVDEMFRWYERESGQPVEQAVIDRLYAETKGQPGLTCWFGELLTEGFEGYQPSTNTPIGPDQFDTVYAAGLNALPNNNILNIVSKAKQAPYTDFILNLFKTDKKIRFTYDDPIINFLYMNGVIDLERVAGERGVYVKFPSPFVQKRLFNYFSHDLFEYMGKLYEPFEDFEDTITDDNLNIRHLMRRYERHVRANREWLLKDAPRRADLRIYEAVYHFTLYMYLTNFLEGFGGRVHPEFPTGNGKIDLIIEYAGRTYGLEVKSFSTRKEYRKALIQAAQYGQQLRLREISLIVFVESIDEANRHTYEVVYEDEETGVSVEPVFVETGS